MSKINFQNVSLTISAGNISQIPKDMPHIVFSGRSNVGKSTLINKILNRNKMARTSSMPGKTITLNFYNIDDTFYIVDLPGYGYAKRSREDQKKWANLVESYLTKENQQIAAAVQLVDLKVGATNDDKIMLNWLFSSEIPYIVAATKADKLNKTNRAVNLSSLNENPHISSAIPFSSLTNEGVEEVRNYLCEVILGTKDQL